MRTGVAIDLGTSGFRAQKIDLETGEIKKTVITLRNPLPGANVMDHLDFAIHYGLDKAHGLSATAVKNILAELGVNLTEMEKFSICGNPIQLSIFQGIPIAAHGAASLPLDVFFAALSTDEHCGGFAFLSHMSWLYHNNTCYTSICNAIHRTP